MTNINIIPGVTSVKPWVTPLKELALPPGIVRQVLAYDPETGKLTWLLRDESMCPSAGHMRMWNTRFAGTEAFTVLEQRGYLTGKLFDQKHHAHRVAWAVHTGFWPHGQIDHENGDKRDNRWDNLRVVSSLENAQNRPMPKHNTSGVIGVSSRSADRDDQWMASIRINGKRQHLGTFRTIEEAAEARKIAEQQYGFHPNHGRAAA